MHKPKYLYRPCDGAAFVLIKDRYSLEASVLESPDSYHHSYEYENLKRLGFLEKREIPIKTREEHILEFLQSFYVSIEKAGGNIGSFSGKTTLQEMANELAQNGIRFTLAEGRK